MKDWRHIIRTPPAYKMGNSTLRVQVHLVAAVGVVSLGLIGLFYVFIPYSSSYNTVSDIMEHTDDHVHKLVKCRPAWNYNATYPLTPPVPTAFGSRFRIAVISDLDTSSKLKEDEWVSYLKRGYLTVNVNTKYVDVKWDKYPITLRSNLALGGRGMELSELVFFNGHLYAVDDRTGIVYEIIEDRVVPWIILADGDGKSQKGFKSEWATIKDQRLYIGGLGKEWTTREGKILNYDPQWVKVVLPTGEVHHENWRDKYNKLCNAAGIMYPGYMVHEAAAWSAQRNKWFFLPRRASREKYDDIVDEKKGTNLMLQSDDNFQNINVTRVGSLLPTHGFSSFKFVPNTNERVIVALKSEENGGKVATFLTVFTADGEIWYPEAQIGNHKFEGIEFV